MTTSSKGKSIFFYRTDRRRLDLLVQSAKEAGYSNTRMLDTIVDDWMEGSVIPPEAPEEKNPKGNWWQK